MRTTFLFRQQDCAPDGALVEKCPLRARPGRPCQIAEPERRKLLLEAAESVFLEQGYSSACMHDIAHRAGMSKKTLYRLFDTKEALFAAMIAERRAELALATDVSEGAIPRAPVADVLKHYLRRLAEFILAPRQAALYRLVIAESQRAPELAHAFYREGPSKARQALIDWLRMQHEQGVLLVADPVMSAAMLFSMVVGDPQMRMLIGETYVHDGAAIEARVDQAVALFMDGARPR